jgi:hypothetical protein
MKSRCAIVCAAVLFVVSSPAQAGLINSAADPALAGSSAITFETTPAQTFSNLTINGVNFSVPAGQAGYISSAYAGQYNSTGQSLQNTYANNAFNSLTITFSNPVNAVGFNWGASDTVWTLTALNASNQVLATRDLPKTLASNAGDFFGLAVNGIKKIVIAEPGSGDYILLDNLHYGNGARVQSVPEPTSAILFGLGFAGVVGSAWRRRNARKGVV